MCRENSEKENVFFKNQNILFFACLFVYLLKPKLYLKPKMLSF